MKLNSIQNNKKPKHYRRTSRNQKVVSYIICIERNAKHEEDIKQAQQSAAKMKETYEAQLNTKQQEAQAVRADLEQAIGINIFIEIQLNDL